MKQHRALRFWLLWLGLTEFALLVLLVPGDSIQRAQIKEMQRIEQRLGPDMLHQVAQTAQGWFRASLIQSGFYQGLHHFLIPSEAERQRTHGLEDFGKGWFIWVEGRLDVLMQLLYQLYIRLALMGLWWPYLLLAGIPALCEGWVRRRIKRTNFDYVSPVIHHYSLRGALYLIGGLGLVFLAPIPLEPMLIPAVLIASCVLAGLAVGNLQKRL